MAVVRIHRYTVEPVHLRELMDRRATLLTAVRLAFPGLTQALLIRLEDGTYADIWKWESADRRRAARPALGFPEAVAAMSLTRDHSAEDGDIIDVH